jgi:hypothetical protein
MKIKHKKMCKSCPWRKGSLKGYLGEDTPKDFWRTTLSQSQMPCHESVNYEDPNWRDSLDDETTPHCAGALQALKTSASIPRDAEHAEAVKAVEVEPDHLDPFSEFLKHHES